MVVMAELRCFAFNSLLLSLSIMPRAWNKLSHTGSFDSEFTLLKLAIAMAPHGVQWGLGGEGTNKQESNELADL